MSAQMVYRDKRQAGGQRKPFGKVDADKQRADQAGRGGNHYRVDAAERQAGVVERLLYHAGDGLGVAAAGDLRHHAAVNLVFLDLRGDYA